MATGIVSIAADQQGQALLARILFGANLLFYPALTALLVLRLIRHWPRVLDDFTSHSRGPGFLTVVAATCVLARQFQIIVHQPATAAVLWLAGLGLWALLIYAFLAATTVREPKPGLETGLNGSWLLLVVSAQSLSVTGGRVAASVGAWRDAALGLTLALFLLGGMFYGLIISLIFYRFTFFRLMPRKLAPPYWINMGAMAITTLAGATLVVEARAWPLVQELYPFLMGLTLVAWVTATWWIPLLLVLGLWRHGRRGFPLSYHPSYWSMVFPLGMYSAASFQLGAATGLSFLELIAAISLIVALAAWIVVLVGLGRGLARGPTLPTPGALEQPFEPGEESVHPGTGQRHGFARTAPLGMLPQAPEACRVFGGAPFPDYVTCPQCGEPEVEVWCYQSVSYCHNCGRVFHHRRPSQCEQSCQLAIQARKS
ncbi:MAG: tellurite resistance/C4-dicarboxylate transporter family protein [Caldilineaceae bacterium]|nr:tellurite resistance/C4-dicarboxylate transporter family protein [Caldilineaceae bacterium]